MKRESGSSGATTEKAGAAPATVGSERSVVNATGDDPGRRTVRDRKLRARRPAAGRRTDFGRGVPSESAPAGFRPGPPAAPRNPSREGSNARCEMAEPSNVV